MCLPVGPDRGELGNGCNSLKNGWGWRTLLVPRARTELCIPRGHPRVLGEKWALQKAQSSSWGQLGPSWAIVPTSLSPACAAITGSSHSPALPLVCSSSAPGKPSCWKFPLMIQKEQRMQLRESTWAWHSHFSIATLLWYQHKPRTLWLLVLCNFTKSWAGHVQIHVCCLNLASGYSSGYPTFSIPPEHYLHFYIDREILP